MPWSAVHPDLNPYLNPNAWKGTDTYWKRKTRGLLSFGPRATEKWAKWRDCPKHLFSFSSGQLRWETKDGLRRLAYPENDKKKPRLILVTSRVWLDKAESFLSRIQPFARFHVALSWPLFISWSIFWKEKDVEQFNPHEYKKRAIKELFCGYLGAKFDPGRPGWPVYHISLSLGGSWE